MKRLAYRWRHVGAGWCTVALMLAINGCSDDQSRTATTEPIGPPLTPVTTVGMATVQGRVLGADGQAVPGAAVAVAETDSRAIADDSGSYRLTVPSDSTVTLLASADGFATTFHESVVVAADAQVNGFDFLMLPPERLQSINGLAGAGDAATRGVVAVRLHESDANCSLAGAHISVWPPRTATVVYSRPDASSGLDQPDLALTAVRPGTRIAAWLVAVLPPGNGLTLGVEQTGCRLMTQSPGENGLFFSGQRHVAPQALTEANLFLEGVAP